MPTSGLQLTADITIIGVELFKKMACAVRLKKKDFQKSDHMPHTYDCKLYLEVAVDGRVLFRWIPMTSYYCQRESAVT